MDEQLEELLSSHLRHITEQYHLEECPIFLLKSHIERIVSYSDQMSARIHSEATCIAIGMVL